MKKKILLLHGWNNKYYSKYNISDSWLYRKIFIDKLSKKYDLVKINFPGFCGELEPKKAWRLDDYAKYVKNYIDNSNIKFDYILGYSFGGAVAVKYAKLFDNKQKLILISPAIVRNTYHSKKMIKTPHIFNKLRNIIRDIYLKRIIKNPYMIDGTKFLNASYQNIVREEVLNDLNELNSNNLLIIYGTNDNMVNPNYVYDQVNQSIKKRIHFINDGTHDIANTNPDDIIAILDTYLTK